MLTDKWTLVCDKEIIDTGIATEPIWKSVEAKLKKFEKPAKTGIGQGGCKTYNALQKVKDAESGQSASGLQTGRNETPYVADLHLLTIKPAFHIYMQCWWGLGQNR